MSKAIHHAKAGLKRSDEAGKGRSAQPIIRIDNRERDEKHISALTHGILVNCMLRAGVTNLTIGSTYRSPFDQARVLYQEVYGKEGEKQYKEMGQEVLKAGHHGEAKYLVDQLTSINKALQSGQLSSVRKLDVCSETKDAMRRKIEELENSYGRGCCSHHQWDPKTYNVFDIYPSSVRPAKHLKALIHELTKHPVVSGIGLPKGYRKTSSKHFRESKSCLHVEIPQGTQGETPPVPKDPASYA